MRSRRLGDGATSVKTVKLSGHGLAHDTNEAEVGVGDNKEREDEFPHPPAGLSSWRAEQNVQPARKICRATGSRYSVRKLYRRVFQPGLACEPVYSPPHQMPPRVTEFNVTAQAE